MPAFATPSGAAVRPLRKGMRAIVRRRTAVNSS
jgi:hypothetical protein